MASTSLFAPQVRAVQPAFVYDKEKINQGEVKIYFSLSSYNNIDEVQGILLTFIDPNRAATWGTNSMIRETIAPAGYLKINFNKENYNYNKDTNEYYFTLKFTELNFKPLTKNQYYQIQLYLSNVVFPKKNIDYDWLDVNKDNISAPSQASLIRPIGAATAIIEEPNLNQCKYLKGRLNYDSKEDEVEIIDTYSYKIKQGNIEVYSSPVFKNVLGIEFNQKITKWYPVEGIEYTLLFSYTTINGYQPNIPIQHTFKIPTVSDKVVWKGTQLISIENDLESGSLKLDLQIDFSKTPAGTLYVERADEFTDYQKWICVTTIDFKGEDNKTIVIPIYDTFVEGNVKYKYRFAYRGIWLDNEIIETRYYQPNSKSDITTNFEDIFLSDKNTMLAVRYNPNITGFKWVTQENLTNTLGGIYPIVRKNGHTKYRQFNLSGTLFFDVNHFNSPSLARDSKDTLMTKWMKENDCSLFFSQKEAQKYITNIDNVQKRRLEKRMRDIALEFLTNNSFKLFRSAEEGSIIVYLSNISFTPNKTLSRQIWDFSATVTEVAELNEENLIKYGFAKENGEAYEIILEALKKDAVLPFTVYISANKILGDDTLILTAKAVNENV